MAAILLVAFVPTWYLLMMAMVPHTPLSFRLFATGALQRVDGRELTYITAGLNALSLIVGFAIFAAVRRTLAFDRRLVSAGYQQRALIGAKSVAAALVASAVAIYAALVLLVFWRPEPVGWLAIVAGFVVVATTYGAFGLLLGVLVKDDLEGFFLIIMVGLFDTFLQNPVGNPLANKPVLRYFPSFGPTQFAVGGAFGHQGLWGYLLFGLAWAAGFAAAGLIIFRARTRVSTVRGEGEASIAREPRDRTRSA
ncbi:MAG TPA: hypothetical protein VGH10_04660 [Actinomycetota bacterium]|jgi:hypothetical protein